MSTFVFLPDSTLLDSLSQQQIDFWRQKHMLSDQVRIACYDQRRMSSGYLDLGWSRWVPRYPGRSSSGNFHPIVGLTRAETFQQHCHKETTLLSGEAEATSTSQGPNLLGLIHFDNNSTWEKRADGILLRNVILRANVFDRVNMDHLVAGTLLEALLIERTHFMWSVRLEMSGLQMKTIDYSNGVLVDLEPILLQELTARVKPYRRTRLSNDAPTSEIDLSLFNEKALIDLGNMLALEQLCSAVGV